MVMKLEERRKLLIPSGQGFAGVLDEINLVIEISQFPILCMFNSYTSNTNLGVVNYWSADTDQERPMVIDVFGDVAPDGYAFFGTHRSLNTSTQVAIDRLKPLFGNEFKGGNSKVTRSSLDDCDGKYVIAFLDDTTQSVRIVRPNDWGADDIASRISLIDLNPVDHIEIHTGNRPLMADYFVYGTPRTKPTRAKSVIGVPKIGGSPANRRRWTK